MRSVAALLLCAGTLAASTAPAAAARLCAYEIPALMVSKIDSATAQSGNTWRFKTAQTVQLRDGTTVAAGTPGEGVIRSADAAARKRHDGSLSLEPRYLMAKTQKGWKRIEVTMNPTLPVVWTPSEPLLQKATGYIPVPIAGIAMQGINLVRYGRNITLGPGFKFAVIPAGNLSQGAIC